MNIKYRPDIDGLRALAVMAVVAYHFKNTIGFNGYMGVDIFFVISGYLITAIIAKDIQSGSFSIRTFYDRRIRRILPALLTVICTATVFSFLIFLPAELLPAMKSSLTSLFFTSNILFYLESGYFNASAQVKPLLHTWSLAVEEQFYILYPLLLIGFFKKSRAILVLVIIALLLISFTSNFFITDRDFNFYMLPTRAWELLMGALLALKIYPKLSLPNVVLSIISGLGLLCIAWGFLAEPNALNPYAITVLPVVFGTVLIIYTGAETDRSPINQLFSIWPARFLGKISYSLYLWHWPVIVFSQSILYAGLTTLGKLGLITLPFILAVLSWKFIEQPFRNSEKSIYTKRTAVLAAILCAIIFSISLSVITNDGKAYWHGESIKEIENLKSGGSYTAKTIGPDIKARVIGPSSQKASIALIGDSHASALAPAFENSKITTWLFHNECFALPDLINIQNMDDCIKDTQLQSDMLKDQPQIKHVFLAQRWNSRSKDWYRMHGLTPQTYMDARENTLVALIQSISAPNRTIHIIAEVPAIESRTQNVPSLYARLKMRGQLDLADFSPSRQQYEENEADMIKMFKRIMAETGANIIWPHEQLCPDNTCAITDNKRFYYLDDDHLSRYGAKQISGLFQQYLN